MKNKGIIIGAAVVAFVIIGLVGVYNSMVRSQVKVENAFANVQAELQRRADLIPNYTNIVQYVAEHENEVVQMITNARSEIGSAKTPADIDKASKDLDTAIGRLIAISEDNIELKSSENFLSFQDELAGTENRVAVARMDYNDAVKEYNTKIRVFPTSLFAGIFGFDKAEQFSADADAQAVPAVVFN